MKTNLNAIIGKQKNEVFRDSHIMSIPKESLELTVKQYNFMT